ncbi:hypothetical protein BO70DRAFT_357155 [Aspergillus heteromorphus CBS 117.55]|uniref:G-patch domain-containing protein n=1 Tax=Aspergillus heteromorphus CBS 117.55 TaxID=1448321 RepID=A0A317X306_9EURO|nr:uncharacterized protein BO70DRAFT_357155 [Aspergillus heteromorphus CBS 117.55]PWY92012.1 hypothetical protein BO70DRAFT_357155 [Aspergillus heteromorphus CBS 117.55]
MDAQAYLLRLGWSGPGNPLNPNRRPDTHSGLGLTRPILVARRQGNLGVGKTTTKDPTNQWWLRGFEDALKGVGTESSATGKSSRAPNALTSELYRHFVRGEVVPGTLGGLKEREEKEKGSEEKARKETKEERKARKEERRVRKEGRRVRREERKKKREEREARRVERREKKELKLKAKAEKEQSKSKKVEEHRPEEDYPTPPATELEQTESSGRDEAEVKEKKKKEKKDSSKKRKTRESSSDDGSKKKSKKSKDEKK